MFWHGPNGMLELTPMNQESITGAALDHVRAKLDELSARGWKLRHVVASQGKQTFYLHRKALGPTSPAPSVGKPVQKKKKKGQSLFGSGGN